MTHYPQSLCWILSPKGQSSGDLDQVVKVQRSSRQPPEKTIIFPFPRNRIFDHFWSILIFSLSQIILTLISFLTLINFHCFIYFFPCFFFFPAHFWLWFSACLILFVFPCLSHACLKMFNSICEVITFLLLFYFHFFGRLWGVICIIKILWFIEYHTKWS